MKHYIRIFALVLLFGLSSFEAAAWCEITHKAILKAVEQRLTKNANKEIVAVLGKPLSEVEFQKERKVTTLNAEGRSVTREAEDAVMRLENALFALDNFGTYSDENKRKALLVVIYHIIDIHSPVNIKIEGLIDGNFTFCHNNGREKTHPRFKTTNLTWQRLWTDLFPGRHSAFSVDMYCTDLAIATRDKAKSYIGGNPRKWVEEIGREVRSIHGYCHEGSEIDLHTLLPLEEMHDKCMYRAVYRLAYMLNKSLK